MRFTPQEMKDMGYQSWRELEDGTILAVSTMAFNNGRLFIEITRSGYEDCYCFDSPELAQKSMEKFNPLMDKEPTGWKRHPYTGRRREKGDPATEYVSM